MSFNVKIRNGKNVKKRFETMTKQIPFPFLQPKTFEEFVNEAVRLSMEATERIYKTHLENLEKQHAYAS